MSEILKRIEEIVSFDPATSEGSVRIVVSVLLAALAAALVSPEIGKTFLIVWSALNRLLLRWKTLGSREGDNPSSPITVSGLFVYPVKSFRKVALQEATIDTKGLVGDRRFMVCTPAPTPLWGHFRPEDATHRFVTQRQCPSLARIQATVDDTHKTLTLECDLLNDSENSITIPLQPTADAEQHRVTLWDDIVESIDMGDAVAQFLQKIVNQDDSFSAAGGTVRLVAQADHDGRATDERYVPAAARRAWTAQSPPVAMQDGFAILIASEASLQELNRRLQERQQQPLPMDRFRPNIVVRGDDLKPFEEDEWKLISINGVVFHIVKGCTRCKQTCTDQMTGQVGDEPLATLATFRAMSGKAEDLFFAQNAIPAEGMSGKTITVGAKVHVLQRGAPLWG